ncbi:hypothetical protein BDQ12DRAFT_37679 [Crucibulum laeve]|uniref:Uncharacterized protein n=1 Tax=Crucibulum laeve TaxID=68775 RepID=A0A5C3MLM8_9AGAR|nr:hypothetical protein BDQ12DRAFT_37679 [Crucibulum laeve]
MRSSSSTAHTSSSATSSTYTRHKKRWSPEQLRKKLEILGPLKAPLPPTLPPSPPASRSNSPAPGFKRKSDSSSDSDHVKRPRTSSFSQHQPTRSQPSHQSHHSHHQQPPQPQQHLLLPQPAHLPSPHLRASAITSLYPTRTEPAEDGEVREEPVQPATSSSSRRPAPAPAVVGPSEVPIRRPKKGRPPLSYFDSLHDRYHNAGRQLKYSGDARFWSTYPPSHREYRPLLNPPSPGSAYHKHGGLIARLELVDALVCFAYSIWNREYGRRSCNRETWRTIEAFLGWCKQKWQAEDSINDAEKAFLGLIFMIEAYIHGRKMLYTVRSHLDKEAGAVCNNIKEKVANAAETAQRAEENGHLGISSGLLGTKLQSTPQMLPSPASIATANSANSTPTNRDEGTPNTLNGRPGAASTQVRAPPPGPPPVPYSLIPKPIANGPQPIAPHVMDAMAACTEPIGPMFAYDIKETTAAIHSAGYSMTNSQSTLSLSVLARHFPTTFARIIHTTLSPIEEHEPDFEDEEGELYWPGQLITGEGLGWVCLMGKAMIKEFGKAYGYLGLEGVVPKPKPEEQAEDGSAPPQQQPPVQGHPLPQRPGTTPQGHHGLPVSMQR